MRAEGKAEDGGPGVSEQRLMWAEGGPKGRPETAHVRATGGHKPSAARAASWTMLREHCPCTDASMGLSRGSTATWCPVSARDAGSSCSEAVHQRQRSSSRERLLCTWVVQSACCPQQQLEAQLEAQLAGTIPQGRQQAAAFSTRRGGSRQRQRSAAASKASLCSLRAAACPCARRRAGCRALLVSSPSSRF